ncbi:MAG: ATP-binding cassette domain-containing protein, partial [Acidobacteria bacterium]|nr:ATP-binding cassette domain-containing protein [Acidobacteriota bacterium]
MPALLRLERVSKVYQEESQPVVALSDVSLQIEAGAFVAFMGPSGCGKSTLLHIMGAMDRPTRGEIWLEEQPLHLRGEEELTRIRRTRVGFVFQFFYLLPTLTVEENVALPLLLAQRNRAGEKAAALLDAVRLSHRRKALPGRLSGGALR